jgi:hypothetical protein
LVIISDRKPSIGNVTYNSLGTQTSSSPAGKVDKYYPDIVSTNDYYSKGIVKRIYIQFITTGSKFILLQNSPIFHLLKYINLILAFRKLLLITMWNTSVKLFHYSSSLP